MIPVIGAGVFLAAARYILTGLGVGIVTFVGLEAVLGQINAVVTSNVGAIGGAAAGVAGLLGLQSATSMVLSAYAVRIALSTLKRFRLL